MDHGYQNNQVPFGYERVPGEKIPQIVPDELAIIKQAFEMYSLGSYSDFDIARWINEQGYTTRKGKEWTKDSVRTTLQLDYYYGAIKHLSVLYPGIYELIIDKELFDRTQKIRKEHFARPRTVCPLPACFSSKWSCTMRHLQENPACAWDPRKSIGITAKLLSCAEINAKIFGGQVIADEVEAQWVN